MGTSLRCPQCDALLPEEAVFCAYCGARVAKSLALPPAPPRPRREPIEEGIYPSDLVYLFSDRFVSGSSTLEWFLGEGNEETPCKNKAVKRRDLARMLLVAALVYMENAKLISLSLGKRRAAGGILMPTTVLASKLSDTAIDPASLEGVLIARLAEPGEHSVFDVVRAVVGQSGRYVERIRSHELATRIVKRHLVQRGLLREVDAKGLGGLTARKKTVGVCEEILPLEPDSAKVGAMLVEYRDANGRIYSRLLDDVYNAIYSSSSMIP